MCPKAGVPACVLAQDLVMTAAHCVEQKGSDTHEEFLSKVRAHGEGVARIVPHPDFRKLGRFVADIALVKLKQPLSAGFVPVLLQGRTVKPGDRVIVGGYGKGEETSQRATLRTAVLAVMEVYDGLFFVRDLPHGGPRVGACSGDSGGPVFTYRGLVSLAGIVVGGDCKGETGVVPVARHYLWLAETADKLGSPIR